MGDVWVKLDELETLDVVLVVVVDGIVVVTLDVVATLDDVRVVEVTEVCSGVTCMGTTRAPGGSRFLGSGIASVWPGAIWANWVGGAKYVVLGGAVVAEVGEGGPGDGSTTGIAVTMRAAMGVSDLCTFTTESLSRPCHSGPVNSSLASPCGSSSGLPESQRTRGIPRLSTSTAVPVCSTD